MRKVLFILLISILTIPCLGQTLEKDTIKIATPDKESGTESSIGSYPTLMERNIFEDQESSKDVDYSINKDYKNIDYSKINMNIYVPQFYQGPISNYLSNSLSPYANDYSYYGGYTLSDRSWLNTSSTHSTYLTIGSISKIGGAYNYLLTDNLTMSVGGYISKYGITNFNGSYKIYNDAGVNAALKYQITDRISIHAFGQYSGSARKHGFDANYNTWMFPQTNFGGAFEYKINSWFGVMSGMERQLNPMTGKWKNVPFVVPVFYGK